MKKASNISIYAALITGIVCTLLLFYNIYSENEKMELHIGFFGFFILFVICIVVYFFTLLLYRFIPHEDDNSIADGLNYSMKHLKEIFPDVIYYDLHRQAQYADHVCRKMVADGMHMDMTDAYKDRNFDNLNTTAIGNIAYVAIYGNSKDGADAMELLERIQAEYKMPK